MPTEGFIIELFYQVDAGLGTTTKHPQATLWPSEVVTLGLHSRGRSIAPSTARCTTIDTTGFRASRIALGCSASPSPIRHGRTVFWPSTAQSFPITRVGTVGERACRLCADGPPAAESVDGKS